jgi:hypothetical protein
MLVFCRFCEARQVAKALTTLTICDRFYMHGLHSLCRLGLIRTDKQKLTTLTTSSILTTCPSVTTRAVLTAFAVPTMGSTLQHLLRYYAYYAYYAHYAHYAYYAYYAILHFTTLYCTCCTSTLYCAHCSCTRCQWDVDKALAMFRSHIAWRQAQYAISVELP